MRGEATPDFVQSSLQDLIQNHQRLSNNSQNVLGFPILAEEQRQKIHCLLSKSGTK